MISFRNVSKSYGQNVAVRDLSFHIERGEFIVLIGASGAGKTTVLQLLHHEIFPTSGVVTVGEYSSDTIRTSAIARLRRKLGFVHQDFRLIRDRSVFENVAIAMRVVGTPRRVIGKRVKEVLAEVGLLRRARDRVAELSGGEQQRVAIARALVNRPYILLADEPTGNLDPDTAAEIYALLDRANLGGTAVLLATHDRELIRRSKHRVLKLAEGMLVPGDFSAGAIRGDEGVRTGF